MRNRIIAFLIVIILAGGFAYGATYVAGVFFPFVKEPVVVSFEDNARPDITRNVFHTIPDKNDAEGHIQLAYELYWMACENFENADTSAMYTVYTTTTLNIPANGYRHAVRNKSEYFYNEYCFVSGEASLLMGLFAKDSTMFADRRYTNDSMSYTASEKVTNPTPTYTLDENNKMTYNVDWGKKKDAELDKPNFERLTDQNVQIETIKWAEVSYNTEEGYYILNFELDVENPLTTQDTIGQLRAGFGNDTAHYTTMTEEFHIWDNGFPKYFRSKDNWTGVKQIIGDMTVEALLDFATYYYYDDYFCNYKNYQYMEEFKSKFVN